MTCTYGDGSMLPLATKSEIMPMTERRISSEFDVNRDEIISGTVLETVTWTRSRNVPCQQYKWTTDGQKIDSDELSSMNLSNIRNAAI
jgi:hypothetical protein